MSLVSQAIANLFNGVSQQSPSIRQPAQAEFQENSFSSIVDGLHKRHPTNFLAKLSSTAPEGNPFIHVINRDAVEQYVLIISDGQLQVWDLEGNQKTVTVGASAAEYIDVDNPAADLNALTIADYTFILNRTKAVRRKSSGETPPSTNVTYGAYNKLPAIGAVGTRYKITGDSDNAWAHYYCKWTEIGRASCRERV